MKLSQDAPAVALIGGTGLERLPPEWQVDRLTVRTPYGDAAVLDVRLGDTRLRLVPRHGEAHHLLPHRVNYHANIAAIVQSGIRRVYATNAVGSLRPDIAPGTLLALDDFIDMTRARPISFLDHPASGEPPVRHADLSTPYCPEMRQALLGAAERAGIALRHAGTYVCVDGPRYESPAEVRMFGSWGGDVVGMTGIPEVVFAREAGLCYSAVAIVTNLGAGLGSSPLLHGAVEQQMAGAARRVLELIAAATRILPAEPQCPCAKSAGPPAQSTPEPRRSGD
jgi:5'-methylthioadenosine phosphorylase